MPSKYNRELATTTNYVWDLKNFDSLASLAKTGYLLQSPLLNLQSINNVWKFHIYPKGKTSEGYIGFYLFKQHICNKTFYDCTLSIGRPNETPVLFSKYYGRQFLGDGVGEEFFIGEQPMRWILRGTVRFQCDISEIDQKALGISLFSIVPVNIAETEPLSLDLEKLLKEPYRSDLTVSMNGHETYIHKYILHARCPNMTFGFNSMLEMPSYIETEISDEIFELLMHYIYTGKIKDSYVPIELFRLAEHLCLTSFVHCVHEKPYSYHAYSVADVEKQTINWDLDEQSFLEDTSIFIHILRTTLYAKRLAIQVTVSNGCNNEQFIDISFKFFNAPNYKPVLLICKISLTSPTDLEVFKEAQYIFLQREQWNFPRISCQKDECGCIRGLKLTAELSICDGSNSRFVINVKTKTKLYTDYQTVTDNLENLSSCMTVLSHEAQSTYNFILLSSDNKFFRVHDGIMWARWPGLRKLLDRSHPVSSDEESNTAATPMELNLPSEVLTILLPYLYTGFIRSFDREKAKLLLRYRHYLEFPHHLVKKCYDVLSDKNGYGCFTYKGGILYRRVLY